MKTMRIYLVSIGIWYLLNLLMLVPPVFQQFLPGMYPAVTGWATDPLLPLLKDAWLVVGIQLAAIGLVALWGAQAPEKVAGGVVPVIIVTELVDGGWDLYSISLRGEATYMGITTIIIHLVIIVAGLLALRGMSNVPLGGGLRATGQNA
jgi:hypothetical protein